MDFLNINETVQSVIRISKGVAREYGNASYAPAHLLFALMHKEVVCVRLSNRWVRMPITCANGRR